MACSTPGPCEIPGGKKSSPISFMRNLTSKERLACELCVPRKPKPCAKLACATQSRSFRTGLIFQLALAIEALFPLRHGTQHWNQGGKFSYTWAESIQRKV